MNIYIEDRGLTQNLRLLKKCFSALSQETCFDLHITSEHKVSLLSLILLVFWLKKIRHIELTQNIKYTTFPILLFANAKNSFSFNVLVHEKLSKNQKKKIERLRGKIHIYDTSTFSNEEYYLSHRNIVFKNKDHDLIDEQKYYGIVSGMPVQNCEFSSCLGKNLYVSPDGIASFCPKRIKETSMCNIYETENFFSNEIFINVLKESIDRRYTCSNCHFKIKCNGYCPLEHCSIFKNKFEAAYTDIQKIVSQQTTLSTIPLYKEQAVLYTLLHSGINKYPDFFRKEGRYD